MLPRKTGKPIAIKCTEQFRQQTEAIADSLGESLSDYVRRAVEERNAKQSEKSNLQKLEEALRPKQDNEIFLSGTVMEETLKRLKPTIPEPKEKAKKFRSFPKGGK
jgi:hypothetical protein